MRTAVSTKDERIGMGATARKCCVGGGTSGTGGYGKKTVLLCCCAVVLCCATLWAGGVFVWGKEALQQKMYSRK
jgi:hypothetical protein